MGERWNKIKLGFIFSLFNNVIDLILLTIATSYIYLLNEYLTDKALIIMLYFLILPLIVFQWYLKGHWQNFLNEKIKKVR